MQSRQIVTAGVVLGLIVLTASNQYSWKNLLDWASAKFSSTMDPRYQEYSENPCSAKVRSRSLRSEAGVNISGKS